MILIKLTLYFLEESDSDFQGRKYKILTFLDPNSLTILRGVNVDTEIKFKTYSSYKCVVELVKGKLRVVSVLSEN